MNQYFNNNQSLERIVKFINYEFREDRFRFGVTSGIFSKDHVDFATDILLNTVPTLKAGGTLLDMGCGYGVIGIVLAKTYSLKLTQVDVNQAALELAKTNAKLNDVETLVLESDCFSGISGDSKYDTIVINPPIHAGKSVTYKMYEESALHLNSGGRLYIVTFKKHGAQSTLEKLNEVFGSRVETLYKKKGVYVFECTSS